MGAWLRWLVVAVASSGWAAGAPGYDVQVELKNLSGEVKTNWPAILRVYAVLGRNLPAGSVNPAGFHVYDAAGREVPSRIEKLPPYDQPGNDELVFVIPKIAQGETLSYRVTNTAEKAGQQASIDVVGSPHNLIGNGDFEQAEGAGTAQFTGQAELDREIKRSGRTSLRLAADASSAAARCANAVRLHKGSWYYFGAWSRTDHVSRFGYQAGNAAHFRIVGAAPDPKDPAKTKEISAFAADIPSQCSTRDWLKCTLEAPVDEWGMDRYHAQAKVESAAVEFVLQQRRHFYMEEGATRGTWWLDDVVLMEQPEVTVRHDLALAPLVKDGVFVFTRPPSMPLGRLDEEKRGHKEWCAMPYAHEALVGRDGEPRTLDRSALRGQRVSFCIGVYHTRPIGKLVCHLTDGRLAAGDSTLAPELVEYCPGYLGSDRRRYMQVLNGKEDVEPVAPAGERGVRHFFLTFHVPKDARPGRYQGAAEVHADDKPLARIPLVIRVQDMVQPIPNDVFVGIIYQGNNPRFDDEGLTVYSRSGFNCITRFGNFLDYEKGPNGAWQVDLAKLRKQMMWLKSYGMVAVSVFSDFDLGPKWNGGALLQRTRLAGFNEGNRPWAERLATAGEAWKAQIRRIEEARKAHPEWPTLIYMTWDEPNLGGGRNGKPDPAMAWLNEVAPDALTTLDVQFDPLPVCLKWYRMPAFDDPADWAGPELYRWIAREGKLFGYCGAADKDEAARYQPGLLMVTSGARYFHAWHLTGGHIAGQVAYDPQTKKLLRAPCMINWGDGMNDLKAYCLLRDAIAAAKASGSRAEAVAAAEAYLKKVFAVFNGDHRRSWSLQPYLGPLSRWGYEQFYDDWQEQMARHAAAVLGVRWMD